MNLPFDRRLLAVSPLSERRHDLDLSRIKPLTVPAGVVFPGLPDMAREMVAARSRKSALILMMGAHVIRAGVQRYLLDLMKRGYVSCLAMNGAGMIHDYEFALCGATTESVSRYIKDGRFGLWRETGIINDIVNRAFREDPAAGMGEAVGKAIREGEFPHKEISLLAAAHAQGIPVTVHVGIGYDIIHEHPNCEGAATGALSYNDFLRFTAVVQRLEGGVVANFGSAIMAPEVFLKALSMARNVARQQGKEIRNFTTLVTDLRDLPRDVGQEPAKTQADYYFRPWKTMLVRTVADGGRSYYVRGRHEETVPALWEAINRGERGEILPAPDPVPVTDPVPMADPVPEGKILDLDTLARRLQEHRAQGHAVVHCHGCFDLMHPGHIKYFQAAKKMGDVLAVTLTPDRFVDKGPGRPVYTQELRAESIAALSCVDYVAVNRWPTAEETLRLLRPAVYVKGQEFEGLEDKTGKIQREAEVVKEVGARLAFTHEIVFSSTALLKEHFLDQEKR